MTTMRSMRFWSAALCAPALLLLTGYTSCEPVLENNGFDLWCGDELCYWDVERGDVRQVPTWHRGDHGVELQGQDVAIAQVTDNVPDCLLFGLVADVEPGTDVSIQIDVSDDGTVEHEERLPASDWAPVEYQFTLPQLVDKARIRITKQGAGRAVLAQIRGSAGEGCLRSLGDICDDDTLCGEGECWRWAANTTVGTCGLCARGDDCSSGEVCGLVFPDDPAVGVYTDCVASESRMLGERCVEDDECATGICSQGRCSTCDTTADCPDGRACAAIETEVAGSTRMCSPGAGLGASGEPCLAPADCSSGGCVGDGELGACRADGRTCDTDASCAGIDWLGAVVPSECVAVGIAGGTCQ